MKGFYLITFYISFSFNSIQIMDIKLLNAQIIYHLNHTF